MAKKLEAFTFKRTRTSRYPWPQWTDGSVWELKRGEDFTAAVDSMKGTCYGYAKRNGYDVQMISQGEVMQVQFKKKKAPGGVTPVRDD